MGEHWLGRPKGGRGHLTLGCRRKVSHTPTMVWEGYLMEPPLEVLICCSISKRFFTFVVEKS